MKILTMLCLLISVVLSMAFEIEIVGYTTSDWTSVKFDVYTLDGKILRYDGSGECSIIPYGFSIHKPQFDSSRVTFRLKLDLAGEGFSKVCIEKGDIGETWVEIFLMANGKKLKIGEFKNSENVLGDPTNRKEFFINQKSALGRSKGFFEVPSSPRRCKRLVLAFYYAWYGTPDGPMGNGRWLHWYGPGMYYQGTNHPLRGLYDSWDEKVLEDHMREALESGIDGFVVSWWGPGSYETDTVKKMLRISHDMEKEGERFYISVYYEGYEYSTEEEAFNDLCFVIDEFAKDRSFLKINGKPVIFIYSRAINSISRKGWENVMKRIRETGRDAIFVADTMDGKFAKIFGGLHIYNVCGAFRKLSAMKAGLRFLNYQARCNDVLYAINIMPGYDDTHIRIPGFSVDRENGKLYEELWKLVLEIDPDIVIITSWNEWHEGSEIEPSVEYGRKFLDLTKKWAELWKNRDRLMIDAEKLKSYFKYQFIPELKLLRASMYVRPDSKRVYIASDNLLACYALKLLGDPLASILEKELEKYGKGYDEEHEIVVGIKIPDVFYARYNEYIDSIFSEKFGLIEVVYEKPDKSRVINDWEKYADLVVYKALNELTDGNLQEAEACFKHLLEIWDGWGFKDESYSSYYQTYKTGLFVILSNRLKKYGSEVVEKYAYDVEKARQILMSLQTDEGGFTVGYEIKDDGVVPADDVNTETTSIVTIALFE